MQGAGPGPQRGCKGGRAGLEEASGEGWHGELRFSIEERDAFSTDSAAN